jgi:CPA2 family monovalent cation:H+ antiporter-2
MPPQTLITTLVSGLAVAFVLGAVANRLRVSPIVGYLLAGVVVGPYTPGFIADQALVPQLAEIGVILLMFGVGMHFSLTDLMSVRAVAVPAALAQLAAGTAFGMGLGWLVGWRPGAGFVFGIALSVASTVVLLRALQDRHLVEAESGRVAIGCSIVQDLAMVLVLVMLPSLADLVNAALGAPPGATSAPSPAGQRPIPLSDLLQAVGITFGKVALFVAVMLVAGRRVMPWLLHYIAHTGSRELFRLAVLAVALGLAYGAAELFDVSFALGAFFAGMTLSESKLSQRAAEESLPLREAFAVLFFVSIGMLVDPAILIREAGPVAATLAIVLVLKSAAAFLVVVAFRRPLQDAIAIAASLAQIGEFSFVLAALGVELGLLPAAARDLILAAALISIVVNPLVFAGLDRLKPWLERRTAPLGPAAEPPAAAPAVEEIPVTTLAGHAVVVGHGRVGGIVAEGLRRDQRPVLVIEERRELVDRARAGGCEVILGNGASPAVIAAANLAAARWLVVAIPNTFEAGQIVAQAREINPRLEIIARAHFDEEVVYLRDQSADLIIMGEREIARGMLEHILGKPAGEA